MISGDKVRIKGSQSTGTIDSSELKRFPHINNGKQIRIYNVLHESGKIMEYELTDLVKI